MVARLAGTVTEMLANLDHGQAICAINVENHEGLTPTMRVAAEYDCPVVVAFSVPAARYFGYEYCSELVNITAKRFGTRYSLHLDHCDSQEEVACAVAAGFTSINYLNDGEMERSRYIEQAMQIRNRFSDHVSLEFIADTLGHVDDRSSHLEENSDDKYRRMPERETHVASILEFARATQPDILGFDCGSLHGMKERTMRIDIELIRQVSRTTALPLVLHGSSGVLMEEVVSAIAAGVRKVNIETAIRVAYMGTVRSCLISNGPAARKPRLMSVAIDEAVGSVVGEYIQAYSKT